MIALAPRAIAPAPEIVTQEDANSLCAAVDRSAALLSELIDQETELVAGGRAHEIEQFQGDKAELSAAYLKQMTRLKENAPAIRALAPEAIEALRPKLLELGAKLLRNQNALAAILQVSERLIRSAALRAIASDAGPSTYGNNARTEDARSANPATAIDRQL